MIEEITICAECGDECRAVPELLSYTGTHCTNGKAGTCTGEYVSNCCLEAVRETKKIHLDSGINIDTVEVE